MESFLEWLQKKWKEKQEAPKEKAFTKGMKLKNVYVQTHSSSQK